MQVMRSVIGILLGFNAGLGMRHVAESSWQPALRTVFVFREALRYACAEPLPRDLPNVQICVRRPSWIYMGHEINV